MNISNKTYNKSNSVNFFADYILNNLPLDSISKIEIAKCENFILIKGKTSSKELINLSEIRDNFIKENNFTNLDLSKTIDLIDYGVKMDEVQTMTFYFHNNSDPTNPLCDFLDTNKEDRLITSSSFPYGYSLKSGRGLYYLAKNIAYNLQLNYVWNTIRITISNKNNEERFQIFSNCEEIQDETLRSAILDCFDFNLEEVEKNFQKSNWLQSTKDGSELDFVKKINSDLVIV